MKNHSGPDRAPALRRAAPLRKNDVSPGGGATGREPAGHGHAGHDHAGHDQQDHDHAGHDHAGHARAGHAQDGGGRDRVGGAKGGDPHGVHGEPLRLTPGRRAVLDILTEDRRAIGAYDLIERLGQRDGRRPAPAQVYRALDYLVENGLAHRLASRNAFLACSHAHCARESVAFLICDSCGGVEEAGSDALASALRDLAQARGFRPSGQMVEISGRCARCS